MNKLLISVRFLKYLNITLLGMNLTVTLIAILTGNSTVLYAGLFGISMSMLGYYVAKDSEHSINKHL